MSDRELSYADDGRSHEPTAQEAARFLQGVWELAADRPPHQLSEKAALDRLAEEYGECFVERVAGVRVIAAAVLAAFSRRLGPGVVHDAGGRCWRRKHHGDLRGGEKMVG